METQNRKTEFSFTGEDGGYGIVGTGISGRGVLRYLSATGLRCVSVRTAQTTVPEGLPPFDGMRIYTGCASLCDITEKVLFLSPAVRPDLPPLCEAEAHGTNLSSDVGLFFSRVKGTCFAVTGSDGKSTTCKIAESILKTGQFENVALAGNIGTALSPLLLCDTATSAYAVELSSFQLMRETPHTRRALITNLTPNHLDWHKSMEEYKAAKAHIYVRCDEPVLFADDETVVSLLGGRRPYGTYSMTKSDKELAAVGAHIAVGTDGDYIRINGKRSLPCAALSLPGRHNLQNFMAAVALTYGYGDEGKLADVAAHLHGMPHRCEYVGEVGGVSFYDSSVDSSPSRTLSTLRSMPRPPVLILCGRSKRLPTDILSEMLPHLTTAVVTTGEFGAEMYEKLTADKTFSARGGRVFSENNLENAVRTAAALAAPHGTVLLSPGATGFDAYKNFDDRGQAFCRAVKKLET